MLYRYAVAGIILSVICGRWGSVEAQTPQLELWKQQYRTAPAKMQQYEALKHICESNYSLSNDSLDYYTRLGEKLFPPGTPQHRLFSRFRINYLGKTGDFSRAEKIATSLLKTPGLPASESIQLKLELMRVRIRSNHAGDAFDLGVKTLKEAEILHDTNAVVTACTLIGWANMELEKYAEAIQWLEKGKAYTANATYFRNNPSLFVNLASCFNNTGRHKDAHDNIDLGIRYAHEGNNLFAIANALNVRADMYIKEGHIREARADLEEALHCRELTGDLFYIVSDMGQLAFFYAANGEAGNGITTAQKGIAMLKGRRQLPKLIYLHQALAASYKAAGLYSEATAAMETILQLKDSLFLANSAEAMAEIRGQYEMEKNKAIIEKQELELSKSRYISIGAISLLALFLMLFLSLWFNYKNMQVRKLNQLMNEQENRAREAIKEAEENERKRIAANLHDNLGAHAGAIRSSIQYLNEGLGNRNEILQQLDHNAGEMVNHLNDTIWILKNQRLLMVHLFDRFKLWVKRLMVNFPDIAYSFSEQIAGDLEMSPQQVLHLFSILKESFYNAIKHSGCSKIEVSLRQDKDWQICISDNGRGFKLSAASGTGYGIENIRQRALENHWTVSWQTTDSGGTLFAITHHINPADE